MRPFEILILVLDFLAIVELNLLPLNSPRWLRFLPLVSLPILVAHLIVEQYRWQMVPAYILTAMLVLLSLPALLNPNTKMQRGWLRVLLGGGAEFLWLGIALLIPLVLPVPRLPTPPGPYAIGSVTFQWTDTTRAELYSGNPNDKREVVAQVWYPAVPAAGAQPIKIIEHLDKAGPIAAASLHLPAFALDHLDLVRTHTFADAPLANADKPFPVVILSPGYTGFRDAYFNQMEALAASGYIAVAIDHPYAMMFIVFPDGRVVVNNPAILPERDTTGQFQRASETLEGVFAADDRFVMDQLEKLNAGSLDTRFAGRLDMRKVGLYGHSTGGGGIVRACSTDTRCKAGLAMDAWLEPVPDAILTKPLSQPFLFMRSERTDVWAPGGGNDARLDTVYRGTGNDAYRMTILGTMHDDFTVVPILTPVNTLLAERGPLPADRTLQIITDYILAFFNKYLKDEPSPLLNGASADYPEVKFESHPQLK